MTPEARIQAEADQLEARWRDDARWQSVERSYTAADVVRLRGSVCPEQTLARLGAERLWELVNRDEPVRALGAITGGQAVQMVKAGLDAIYLSGWQVAADANLAGSTYPDQSLYPANSVPSFVRRLNNALQRADQIDWSEGRNGTYWFAPILADAEAGFGGPLNAYELMRAMIEAGAAGVHFEDQLASEKKCGHLGGKVLVPTGQFVRTLTAARLAADVCGVPSVLIARTDALSSKLLTSDHDPRDRQFLTGDRTSEGFFVVHDGLERACSDVAQHGQHVGLAAHRRTEHLDLAEEDVAQIDLRVKARRRAARDDAPTVLDGLDARREHVAADMLDHGIDAALVR